MKMLGGIDSTKRDCFDFGAPAGYCWVEGNAQAAKTFSVTFDPTLAEVIATVSDAKWPKMRAENAQKAIDFLRAGLSDAGKELGPAAGMGEFMFQVGNYEQLMELTLGLKDVVEILIEGTGTSYEEILDGVSNNIDNKRI